MTYGQYRGLFLDDERFPEDVTWVEYPANVVWTIVRTYEDFISEMETDEYLYYSFDHDIQDFSFMPKGTPVAETAFGTVYSEEDSEIEWTGHHAAQALRDHITHSLKPVKVCGWFVYSKNPIGNKKIENTLKDMDKCMEELS